MPLQSQYASNTLFLAARATGFFFNPHKTYRHEAFVTESSAPGGCLDRPRPRIRGLAASYLRLGGYVGEPAAQTDGWMLLRVRTVENQSRLQQNVRIAEICFAVVGG